MISVGGWEAHAGTTPWSDADVADAQARLRGIGEQVSDADDDNQSDDEDGSVD